jgi:hypothetical protein
VEKHPVAGSYSGKQPRQSFNYRVFRCPIINQEPNIFLFEPTLADEESAYIHHVVDAALQGLARITVNSDEQCLVHIAPFQMIVAVLNGVKGGESIYGAAYFLTVPA